jgi:hypothetical protein
LFKNPSSVVSAAEDARASVADLKEPDKKSHDEVSRAEYNYLKPHIGPKL